MHALSALLDLTLVLLVPLPALSAPPVMLLLPLAPQPTPAPLVVLEPSPFLAPLTVAPAHLAREFLHKINLCFTLSASYN
jgi:hypothetical protein